MDITDLSDRVFQCYARKQSTYYVNRVYPHWNVSDLRSDLIDKAREMAITRKLLFEKQRHPWADMDNEELLRTSGLILTDEKGRKWNHACICASVWHGQYDRLCLCTS